MAYPHCWKMKIKRHQCADCHNMIKQLIQVVVDCIFCEILLLREKLAYTDCRPAILVSKLCFVCKIWTVLSLKQLDYFMPLSIVHLGPAVRGVRRV